MSQRSTNQMRYVKAARPVYDAMVSVPDVMWNTIYPFYLTTLDALTSTCYGDHSSPWTRDYIAHQRHKPTW